METVIKFLEKHFTKTRVRILICLILMAVGFTNSQIKDKLKLDYKSLKKYRNALDNKDIECLFSNGGNRRKSDLDKHTDEIKRDFDENPPTTLKVASDRIKELTGKTLSLNRLGIFLKKRA